MNGKFFNLIFKSLKNTKKINRHTLRVKAA